MSVVTVELPNELEKRLGKIAKAEGVSISQLLVETAEKFSRQAEFFAKIKRQAAQRDTRKSFETFLDAVPDLEPENPADKIN